jgi:hypothetical protein
LSARAILDVATLQCVTPPPTPPPTPEQTKVSRYVAQHLVGADCSLKLDWLLRYRMQVYGNFEMNEMAEDRYAEICAKARREF